MKKVVMAVSMWLALGVIGPALAEEWPETPARLSLVEGGVAVQMAGSPEGVAATSNLPLGPGDQIWITGHGRVEIQLPDGNALRLGDDASVELGASPSPAAWASAIRLERGTATFYVRRQQPELPAFVVELRQGSIRVATPSTFRIDLFPDGSVQVSVHSGEVTVALPEGATEVRSRQSLRLTPNRTPQLYALAPWDEFDRWNDLRDIQLTRPVGGPYLPAELTPYAPDFVAYGHWIPVPPYGYGWAPTVDVGWSPFREGRWVSWRGELTWFSSEPWGWAPYHYGRWLFYPATGWVWIPPAAPVAIWNPGAVAWVTGPEFVAWIPLAPGEIFFGFRNFGPGSVNVTNVQVTNLHVTNVFVNTRATNAAVITHRDVFLKGGRAPASFIPPKDLFAAGGRHAVGPPPLRPGAALLQPVPPRLISTPLRRAPEAPRLLTPTTRGSEVGERIRRPPSTGLRTGFDQAHDRPGAVEIKRPAPHPEVHQRRLAPEILLRSSPPRLPSVLPPHPTPVSGEGRSMRELRGPAMPLPHTPHGEVRPGPARGKEGRTVSPATGKDHPHPPQTGGR